MNRIVVFISIILSIALSPADGNAQLMRKAGQMIQSAFQESASDSVGQIRHLDNNRSDSARMHELELQLQEMRLNEMQLRAELNDALNGSSNKTTSDISAHSLNIDSLKAVTPGVPVEIEGDTLFTIYTPLGGFSPQRRAEMANEALLEICNNRKLSTDTLHLLQNDRYIDIMCGDRVIVTITETDALWEGTTPQLLAKKYIALLDGKIKYLRNENSFWMILKRAGMFVLVLALLFISFKLVNHLFGKIRRKIATNGPDKLHPLIIRDYELLNTHRMCRMLILASNILRYAVLAFLLILTVPILFAIFPQTENLALRIFSYIIDPMVMIAKSVIEYIPNLFIIAIIWFCVKYIVRGLRYITNEIQEGKLRISGFYPEWATPTFNIVRFLLYAFMIAMIYPYLPGSQSGVFQGISVFVGLIVSLGSSGVISNFIAGFVITYMRPFKSGDFIKVQDATGNVIEKTPFVTRLRTIKNEVITIPNSFIMSANTVNYSASARSYGLIIHTTMTMGYDVPWRKVHQLLIEAALSTSGVQSSPEPFVLETQLDDNYMCYQINAYITDADEMPVIKSDLLQNIQDLFHKANIDLYAPHYYGTREGKGTNTPPDLTQRIG